MECEEIKKIIPQYFQHTASEEEIQLVEEHLCVCHDCRTILGELIDKASEAEEAASSQGGLDPVEEAVLQETGAVSEQSPDDNEGEVLQSLPERGQGEEKEDMEYFPAENIEDSLDKVDEILGVIKPEPSPEEPKKEEPSFEVLSEPEPVKEELKQPEEPQEAEPFSAEKLEEELEEKEEEPVPVYKPPEEPQEAEPFFAEKFKEKLEEKEDEPEPALEPESEMPVKEPAAVDIGEPHKDKIEQYSEELTEPFDRLPLEGGGSSLLAYFCLIAGLGILGFLAYLLVKG